MKQQLGFCCALLCTLFFVNLVEARPVSYPGGWTAMFRNDHNQNSLHVHYSPSPKYSVGLRSHYHRDDGYQTQSLQVNSLIKRWNMKDAQANLYLKSAVGIAFSTNGDFQDDEEFHYFTGFAADWENRRFFTGYENRYHDVGDFNDEFHQSVMLGVAPYIGEYGDLHTWLMVKVTHEPEDEDNFTVIPHVRFFKDVYLLEIGITDDEEAYLNFIVRF